MSTADPFPQTELITQTNSLGVVTGQPNVATSDPENLTTSTVETQPVTSIVTSLVTPVGTLPDETPRPTTITRTSILPSSASDESLSSGTPNSASIVPTASTVSTTLASSSSPASSTNLPSGANKGSTNIGAIVGGVIGGLTVIGIVIVALYWIRRRHPRTPKDRALPEALDAPPGYGDASMPEVAYAQHNAPGHGPQELDGRWNQINELPALKK